MQPSLQIPHIIIKRMNEVFEFADDALVDGFALHELGLGVESVEDVIAQGLFASEAEASEQGDDTHLLSSELLSAYYQIAIKITIAV